MRFDVRRSINHDAREIDVFKKMFIAAALLAAAVSQAGAQEKAPFALDWKFEGPAAPYLIAIDKGYFGDEGLAVEISEGKGSLDAIPKVATLCKKIGF